MFNTKGTSFIDTIGERNVEAVRETLAAYGIPLVAEDVGENYGRTVYFMLEDGMVKVQSVNKNVNVI